MEETKIVPDWHIVALTENLDDWTLPEVWNGKPLKRNVKRIEGVYAYDSKEVTYLCEMTPSYWMEFLEYRFVFKNDEEAPEDSDTFFHELDRAEQHKYVHCHEIDDIVDKLKKKPFRYSHVGDPFDGAGEDDIEENYTRFDAIRELWNTNPPI